MKLSLRDFRCLIHTMLRHAALFAALVLPPIPESVFADETLGTGSSATAPGADDPSGGHAESAQQEGTNDVTFEKVKPIIENSCYDCHDGSSTAQNQDFVVTDAVMKDLPKVRKMLAQINSGKMPPPNSDYTLEDGDKDVLNKWKEKLTEERLNIRSTSSESNGVESVESVAQSFPFRSQAQDQSKMREYLQALPEWERQFKFGFSLSSLHNNPYVEPAKIDAAKSALAITLSSLARDWLVGLPESKQERKLVKVTETLYAVDLRDLTPYQVGGYSQGSNYQNYYHRISPHKLKHLMNEVAALDPFRAKPSPEDAQFFRSYTHTELPIVNAQVFLLVANQDPYYSRLHNFPQTVGHLFHELGVHLPSQKPPFYAGTKESGVTFGARRIVSLFKGHNGTTIWESADFNAQDNNVYAPLSGFHELSLPERFRKFDPGLGLAGGEGIIQFPNGLPGYYAINNVGRFISAVPSSVAHDPETMSPGGGEVINAISCIRCHDNGMRKLDFVDTFRNDLVNSKDPDKKALALEYYFKQEDFKKRQEASQERFRQAVVALGAKESLEYGDSNPIWTTVKPLLRPLTAEDLVAFLELPTSSYADPAAALEGRTKLLTSHATLKQTLAKQEGDDLYFRDVVPLAEAATYRAIPAGSLQNLLTFGGQPDANGRTQDPALGAVMGEDVHGGVDCKLRFNIDSGVVTVFEVRNGWGQVVATRNLEYVYNNEVLLSELLWGHGSWGGIRSDSEYYIIASNRRASIEDLQNSSVQRVQFKKSSPGGAE